MHSADLEEEESECVSESDWPQGWEDKDGSSGQTSRNGESRLVKIN